VTLAKALRQCRHLSQMRATDLDLAVAELAASRSRATTFARQQEQALLHLASREEAVARLQAEQARLAAVRRSEEEARHHTEAALRAEIEELLRHRDEARMLRQTISWRVTRPLRAIRRPRTTLRILIRSMLRAVGG
jgi:predicted transcriptional regulator